MSENTGSVNSGKRFKETMLYPPFLCHDKVIPTLTLTLTTVYPSVTGLMSKTTNSMNSRLSKGARIHGESR